MNNDYTHPALSSLQQPMKLRPGSAMRWSRRVRLKSPGTPKISRTPICTRRRARWRPIVPGARDATGVKVLRLSSSMVSFSLFLSSSFLSFLATSDMVARCLYVLAERESEISSVQRREKKGLETRKSSKGAGTCVWG